MHYLIRIKLNLCITYKLQFYMYVMSHALS